MQTRFYRHYKNKPYRVLGTARHSETLEELTLYETLYENEHGKLWVRPKKMFFENIEKDGKKIPRFEHVQFNYSEKTQLSDEDYQAIELIGKQCFPKINLSKIREQLNSKEKIFFQLIFDRNEAVAFKLGYAESEASFYTYLGAVLPSYRGLGLAQALIENQEKWCKKNQFIFIKTKSTNLFPAMISLNLRNGFRIYGVEEDPGKELKILFQKAL